MKKNTYKARTINSETPHRWSTLAAAAAVTVGIDVGKHKMVAALARNGEVLDTVKWTFPENCLAFLDLVTSLKGPVEVALEPSGTYGDPLRHQLEARGIPVFRVSPKHSHDFTEVLDGVPSTHDAKSAAVIVQLHAMKKGRRWVEHTDQERDIRAQLDMLELFLSCQQKYRGVLESRLARYWPGLSNLLDMGQASMLALLETFGSPRAVAEAPIEADWVLKQASRGRLSEEKRGAILRNASQTTGVAMTPQEVEQLKNLARELLHHRDIINEQLNLLSPTVEAVPEVKAMAEVVGPRAALSILGDVRSPLAFESPQAFQKALGLNMREHSSGTVQGRLKITKRGPERPRRLLYLATLRLNKAEPLVEAWYNAKVQRDGGKKKRAIIAVMRKLTLALWHVARGHAFDARRLFNAQLLEGVAAQTTGSTERRTSVA